MYIQEGLSVYSFLDFANDDLLNAAKTNKFNF